MDILEKIDGILKEDEKIFGKLEDNFPFKNFTKGRFSGYDNLTIPKGTRMTYASHDEWFVDDLSWIDIKKYPILYDDAVHYGIRIPKNLVISNEIKEEFRKGQGVKAIGNNTVEGINLKDKIGIIDSKAGKNLYFVDYGKDLGKFQIPEKDLKKFVKEDIVKDTEQKNIEKLKNPEPNMMFRADGKWFSFDEFDEKTKTVYGLDQDGDNKEFPLSRVSDIG